MELFKMEIMDKITHSTLELLDRKDVSTEDGIAAVVTSTCEIIARVALQKGIEPNKFVRDVLVASAEFWYETHK